jgi:hypothetical protein
VVDTLKDLGQELLPQRKLNESSAQIFLGWLLDTLAAPEARPSTGHMSWDPDEGRLDLDEFLLRIPSDVSEGSEEGQWTPSSSGSRRGAPSPFHAPASPTASPPRSPLGALNLDLRLDLAPLEQLQGDDDAEPEPADDMDGSIMRRTREAAAATVIAAAARGRDSRRAASKARDQAAAASTIANAARGRYLRRSTAAATAAGRGAVGAAGTAGAAGGETRKHAPENELLGGAQPSVTGDVSQSAARPSPFHASRVSKPEAAALLQRAVSASSTPRAMKSARSLSARSSSLSARSSGGASARSPRSPSTTSAKSARAGGHFALAASKGQRTPPSQPSGAASARGEPRRGQYEPHYIVQHDASNCMANISPLAAPLSSTRLSELADEVVYVPPGELCASTAPNLRRARGALSWPCGMLPRR